MAYIMMGRVENVQNLYITGTFDEKKIRCDKKALQEALRLERISLSWKTRDVCYLSIVSMNVRSLVKHQRDVLADYKVLQKDVICLQETWLYPEQEKNNSLADYTSNFASVGKGKGLATFTKPPVEGNVSLVDIHTTFQLMSTQVKGIMLISVYISSNCSNLEAVVEFLSQNSSDKCIIMGDFNFTPDSSNIITRQLQAWNIFQLIKSPTHKDGNILDHVYVSKSLSALVSADIHYIYYSDHQGLFINIIDK